MTEDTVRQIYDELRAKAGPQPEPNTSGRGAQSRGRNKQRGGKKKQLCKIAGELESRGHTVVWDKYDYDDDKWRKHDDQYAAKHDDQDSNDKQRVEHDDQYADEHDDQDSSDKQEVEHDDQYKQTVEHDDQDGGDKKRVKHDDQYVSEHDDQDSSDKHDVEHDDKYKQTVEHDDQDSSDPDEAECGMATRRNSVKNSTTWLYNPFHSHTHNSAATGFADYLRKYDESEARESAQRLKPTAKVKLAPWRVQ